MHLNVQICLWLYTISACTLKLEEPYEDVVNHLECWAAVNKMEINAKKTKDMWISFKKTSGTPPPLHVKDVKLERVRQFKLPGVAVQNDIKWNSHMTNIASKASKRIYHVRACRKAIIPAEVGLTIYITKIRTLLAYAIRIWGGLPECRNIAWEFLDFPRTP